TLRALHARSSQGMRAAKALGVAGLIAAADKFWAEGLSHISASLERFSSGAILTGLQRWLLGNHYEAWSGRTVVFSWDFIFLAAGALVGILVFATILLSWPPRCALFRPVLPADCRLHPARWLRGHRAGAGLVRRLMHGGRRPLKLRPQLAHCHKCVPGSGADVLLAFRDRGSACSRRGHRGADDLVCHRSAGFARCSR